MGRDQQRDVTWARTTSGPGTIGRSGELAGTPELASVCDGQCDRVSSRPVSPCPTETSTASKTPFETRELITVGCDHSDAGSGVGGEALWQSAHARTAPRCMSESPSRPLSPSDDARYKHRLTVHSQQPLRSAGSPRAACTDALWGRGESRQARSRGACSTRGSEGPRNDDRQNTPAGARAGAQGLAGMSEQVTGWAVVLAHVLPDLVP